MADPLGKIGVDGNFSAGVGPEPAQEFIVDAGPALLPLDDQLPLIAAEVQEAVKATDGDKRPAPQGFTITKTRRGRFRPSSFRRRLLQDCRGALP